MKIKEVCLVEQTSLNKIGFGDISLKKTIFN